MEVLCKTLLVFCLMCVYGTFALVSARAAVDDGTIKAPSDEDLDSTVDSRNMPDVEDSVDLEMPLFNDEVNDEMSKRLTSDYAVAADNSSTSDQNDPPSCQGPPGRDGRDGRDGQDGEDGVMGLKGDQGILGAAGSVGPEGPAGSPGASGPSGPQGSRGPRGLTGLAGGDGQEGQAGSPGSPGAPGAQGSRGSAGDQGPPGLPAPNSGAVYKRWGRTVCPLSASLVYKGIMGGKWYAHSGSGSNYLCLPENPQYDNYETGNQIGRALVYSVEYSFFDFSPLSAKHNHDAPCAVCEATGRGRLLMIPAWKTCPSGWTKEYNGYLMADIYTNSSPNEFICVDRNPEARPGSSSDQNGAKLTPTEGRCDAANLPCAPYINGAELTCVVCTK